MKKIFLLLTVALFFACSDDEDQEPVQDDSYYQMLVGEWEQDYDRRYRPPSTHKKIAFYPDSTFEASNVKNGRNILYHLVNWRYDEEKKAWVADEFKYDLTTWFGNKKMYAVELYRDSLHISGFTSFGAAFVKIK